MNVIYYLLSKQENSLQVLAELIAAVKQSTIFLYLNSIYQISLKTSSKRNYPEHWHILADFFGNNSVKYK